MSLQLRARRCQNAWRVRCCSVGQQLSCGSGGHHILRRMMWVDPFHLGLFDGSAANHLLGARRGCLYFSSWCHSEYQWRLRPAAEPLCQQHGRIRTHRPECPRTDYREHLNSMVARDLGAKYVRGHGMFNNDMHISYSPGSTLLSTFCCQSTCCLHSN